MARVVFMGTPDYAIPSLQALHTCHKVLLVVTQPDRRQGRGRQVTFSPVKQFALDHQLPIWQPTTLHTPEAVERLQDTQADLYVTAAVGFLIPPDVLALPLHGCLNVHASLLPRWRGAAPIAATILHGDVETGVTLMQTDEGLDTGPILTQARCAVEAEDTTETLTPRLARMGADLLIESLPGWLSGAIVPQPQPEQGVTFAPRLTKQDGRIDWSRPAVYIERMTRAYTPWPSAYTTFRGQLLKVVHAHPLPDWRGTGRPGEVKALPNGDVAAVTGQGALVLLEVQMAGKQALPCEAFVCGYQDFAGSILGEPA